MTTTALWATLLRATALLCCVASVALAQPSPAELADDPALFLDSARKRLKWDEPAEPARLVGPIYFVGTKGLSVFLITGSEGHVVINTGMPGSGPMIEASIRKLGFEPKDVKLLLAGHAHVDHVGGHAYLKEVCGARIAMIQQEKDLFESGGKLDFHYGKYKEFAFEPAKVERTFKDGEVIKLGDIEITALLTPGHTQGSTTFVMNVTDRDAKDGDANNQEAKRNVVFPNGTSVNPGYRLIKLPSYPRIADDYRRTMRVLAALKPDVWLHPHNEAYGFAAKQAASAKQGGKAWVDPAGYQKWVADQREKLEAAITKEGDAAQAK